MTVSPYGSVGLKLFDTGIVKRHDPQWFDDRDCISRNAQGLCTAAREPLKFTTPIDHFDWNTRVVFIALCEAADTFLEMWGIDQNTPGRALIVPVSSPTALTDLNLSALAWVWISIKLSDGHSSVYDAVKYANDNLARSVYSDGRPVQLRFRAIGSNEGRNVKK